MLVEWLGRKDFESAWSLQETCLEELVGSDTGEKVLLVEHPHVITLGRRGERNNILTEEGFDGERIQVLRINRGGDVTYHGPGQLIGYPILNLASRGRDIHRYLRQLESVLIRLVASFGLEAFQREGLTGVWTREGKLASIGVGVKRWVTQHGFALNVCPDLRYFGLIHPCGIPDCQVVSLQSLLDEEVTIEDVLPLLEKELRAEFGNPNDLTPSEEGASQEISP